MSTDTSVRAKVCGLRDDLQSNLLEREAAIDAAILALVTRGPRRSWLRPARRS